MQFGSETKFYYQQIIVDFLTFRHFLSSVHKPYNNKLAQHSKNLNGMMGQGLVPLNEIKMEQTSERTINDERFRVDQRRYSHKTPKKHNGHKTYTIHNTRTRR